MKHISDRKKGVETLGLTVSVKVERFV